MTTMPDTIGEATAPEEIRAAIDRMVTSDVFSRSPQLGAFLRFVTEAVLTGKTDRIKAYTIGVEVLRRDTKFDPQLDPIVRVEATRLRRTIERYYMGAGAGDPVIVDLPRGSYVPTFRRREVARGFSMPAWWTASVRRFGHRPSPARLAAAAGVVAIVAAAIVGGMLVDRTHRAVTPVASSARDFDGQQAGALPRGNGMPTLQIERLRVIGTPSPGAVMPERLHAKISDAFARFDTINVASDPVPAEPQAGDVRAAYRLAGAVEFSGDTADVWFTLTSNAEGTVVWSRRFDRVQPPGRDGVSEDSIVVTLTNSLLQSYGVIRARDRAGQLASNEGDPRYRCVLEAADAIRTADRRMHVLGRTCLENLTAADPSFAVGFIFLSMLYNREFQLGYESRAGELPALDRALRTARHAIALHPEDSRGYLALMVIQFNRRDVAAALAAGDKSIALNKYDMLALGEYGGRLVFAGEVDRGMQMLRQAGAHGAVRPAWHHVYMFIGSYISGDMVQAERSANDITQEDVALGQVVRALAAKAAGDREACRKAIERLQSFGAGWRSDPRAELARLIADSSIVDRLASDLASVGLRGGA